MLPAEEPISVALLVCQLLERQGVEYLVGGSLASSIHGIPRATLDVDIVADLRMHHVKRLVAELQEGFYADEGMIADAVRRRTTFNVLHLATMFKIDVFVAGDDELIAAELSRKQRVRVRDEPPCDVNVATAEDMVLQKLLWYRAGGSVSDRQWADIIGIVRTCGGALDLAYLQDWATRKGLTELLARVYADAG
jgi:hypothetical protein